MNEAAQVILHGGAVLALAIIITKGFTMLADRKTTIEAATGLITELTATVAGLRADNATLAAERDAAVATSGDVAELDQAVAQLQTALDAAKAGDAPAASEEAATEAVAIASPVEGETPTTEQAA